jgi:hydrogenase expression/formation protein HypC
MCLGVPCEVVSVQDDELRTAKVRLGSLVKEVSLVFVPDAVPGDHVIVHVGFAISKIDRAEAERVLDYHDRIGEIEGAGA